MQHPFTARPCSRFFPWASPLLFGSPQVIGETEFTKHLNLDSRLTIYYLLFGNTDLFLLGVYKFSEVKDCKFIIWRLIIRQYTEIIRFECLITKTHSSKSQDLCIGLLLAEKSAISLV